MNVHKQGSALLIIFFLVQTIVLVCWLVWRTTSWGVECVLEKQSYEQQRQALHALCSYAQLIINDNYQTIIDGRVHRELRFDHWPDEKGLWNASIKIDVNNDEIESTCSLYSKRALIASKKVLIRAETVHDESSMLSITWYDDNKNWDESSIS